MDTITMPITGKKIKIALSDFPGLYKWEDANNACKALGKGWRLPTYAELQEMHKFQNEIGGFCTIDGKYTALYSKSDFARYWSSDTNPEYDKYEVKYYRILRFDCDLNSILNENWSYSAKDECKVRAVKTSR